jgi:hypothetical protein
MVSALKNTTFGTLQIFMEHSFVLQIICKQVKKKKLSCPATCHGVTRGERKYSSYS